MSFGQFPFGLDPAQEARAARLHRESTIIELMFQGPCSYRSLEGDLLAAERQDWQTTGDGQVFTRCLARLSELAAAGRLPDYEAVWRESGITAANLQIITDHRQGHHQLRLAELSAYPSIRQARDLADILEAKARQQHVCFLNYQFVPPSVADLDWFDEAAAIGVRMVGLTYNHPNRIGVGCTSTDTGLTAFGRDVIARLNDLGIIVDVAHAGTETAIGACQASRHPVIASHSGARAVTAHNRCKTDDALRAIRDSGGVCGVVAVPAILTPGQPGQIDIVFDHIDYLANRFGIDFVALGTDWPMELPKWVLERGGPMEQWTLDMGFARDEVTDLDRNLVGFDDYRDYPNLTRGLVARGWSDEEIRKILGGNALRVIAATWQDGAPRAPRPA